MLITLLRNSVKKVLKERNENRSIMCKRNVQKPPINVYSCVFKYTPKTLLNKHSVYKATFLGVD